jgi:hypothetical protein
MHRALPAAALGCIAAATQRRARSDATDAPPPPVYRRQSLEHVQLGERWPRDTAGMVGIPKRAWPERQPEVEEVPALRELLRKCVAKGGETCSAERFVLATALIGSRDDQAEGAALYAVDANDDADAACALGICYQSGTGVDIDETRALQLFREAVAKTNHAQSHYEIGAMAYVGQGMDEDEAVAFEHWAKAAAQGHPAAAFMLGDVYLEGLAVPKDADRALRWFVFAGDRGHRGARSRAFALTQPETTDEETMSGRYTDGSRMSIADRVEGVASSE